MPGTGPEAAHPSSFPLPPPVDLRLWFPLWAPSGGCDGFSLPVLRPPQPPSSLSALCSHSRLTRGKRRTVETQICSEVLTLLSNLADLANAVHWLPPGVLWAGRFPQWLVGLLGTLSSLLSVYQAVQAGGQANATP